jgi:hypothetical protein
MSKVDLSNKNVYDYVNMGEVPNDATILSHEFEDNIQREKMMYDDYYRQINNLSMTPSSSPTPLFNPATRMYSPMPPVYNSKSNLDAQFNPQANLMASQLESSMPNSMESPMTSSMPSSMASSMSSPMAMPMPSSMPSPMAMPNFMGSPMAMPNSMGSPMAMPMASQQNKPKKRPTYMSKINKMVKPKRSLKGFLVFLLIILLFIWIIYFTIYRLGWGVKQCKNKSYEECAALLTPEVAPLAAAGLLALI